MATGTINRPNPPVTKYLRYVKQQQQTTNKQTNKQTVTHINYRSSSQNVAAQTKATTAINAREAGATGRLLLRRRRLLLLFFDVHFDSLLVQGSHLEKKGQQQQHVARPGSAHAKRGAGEPGEPETLIESARLSRAQHSVHVAWTLRHTALHVRACNALLHTTHSPAYAGRHARARAWCTHYVLDLQCPV